MTRFVSLRWSATLAVAAGLATTTACFQKPTPPSNQELRSNTADATRDLKANAKVAARDAGAVAKEAAKSLGAVAAGVHDGLKSDTSEQTEQVDINSASTARLAMLPGIGLSEAHAIVQGRPYSSTHALVSKGVLTREKYLRIASRIKASK